MKAYMVHGPFLGAHVPGQASLSLDVEWWEAQGPLSSCLSMLWMGTRSCQGVFIPARVALWTSVPDFSGPCLGQGLD